MKKKPIGKKLRLGKETVSRLDSKEMSKIHGANGLYAPFLTHEPTEIPELCHDSEYSAAC